MYISLVNAIKPSLIKIQVPLCCDSKAFPSQTHLNEGEPCTIAMKSRSSQTEAALSLRYVGVHGLTESSVKEMLHYHSEGEPVFWLVEIFYGIHKLYIVIYTHVCLYRMLTNLRDVC